MTKKEKCLEDFLTIEQVAHEIKYTVPGVTKAIWESRLRAWKKGRQWLIHKSWLKEFREKNKV